MITIGTAIAVSAAANAAVHVYRQDLPTPTCVQDHFKVELDPDKPTTGPSYRVETDSAGRLLRLDAMRDGKVLSGYRVRYGKTGSTAIFAFFSAGKPTSEQRCVRDAGGTLTRTDVVSAAGVLTEYDLFSPVYSPRSALETWTAYTPRGNKAKTETDYFNIDGVLTRVRSQDVGETSYRVTEFDPDTGLAQTRRVFDTSSRQLKQTFKFTYDRSGDRTRADIFDAKGARYGSMQYVAGLETRRQYQRANGTSEV
jgi:hypothetical protein